MSFEFLRSESTEDGVLILTMDDPKTRNSYGGPLAEEMESEIDRFSVSYVTDCEHPQTHLNQNVVDTTRD